MNSVISQFVSVIVRKTPWSRQAPPPKSQPETSRDHFGRFEEQRKGVKRNREGCKGRGGGSKTATGVEESQDRRRLGEEETDSVGGGRREREEKGSSLSRSVGWHQMPFMWKKKNGREPKKVPLAHFILETVIHQLVKIGAMTYVLAWLLACEFLEDMVNVCMPCVWCWDPLGLFLDSVL